MTKTTTLFIITLIAICLFFSISHAEEKKEKKTSKAEVSFSGDVQYRLRGDILVGKDENGDTKDRIANHQNLYGWNFMSKAVMSDNLLLGFRLSNPGGYSCDDIMENINKANQIITVPEAYFKWNLDWFSIAAGIIPVKGNTTLSFSAYTDDGYRDAVSGWKTRMNASQIGTDLSFSFLKNDQTSFGFHSLYSIARGVGKTNAADAFKNEQLRFLFSFPLSILKEKLSFDPAMHLQTNVYRSADLDKANHALIGGIDINIKPVKQLGIKLGFAAGGHKNDCLEDGPGYDTLKTAPLGILSVLALKVKPGYGKGDLIFKISNSKDREAATEVQNTMFRWDLKYEFPIKGFVIKPRLRIWYGINDADDAVYCKIRPSLILIGRFK